MNLKVPNIVAVAAGFLLAAFFLLVFALGVAVQR
jgi:hypothetical protein|tara:strand:+ start:991 stop:1092 length:102 start_codon:yes stop_codon:yes gene_type:complete